MLNFDSNNYAMKRNLLVIIALMSTSVVAFSQITVTNAGWPKAGDVVIDRNAEGQFFGIMPAASTNALWDFSQLKEDSKDTTAYLAAATGDFFADFPTSDLRVSTQGSESYLDKTSASLTILGLVFDPLGVGIPIVAKFNPNNTFLVNPTKYFDVSNSSFVFGASFSAELLAGTGILDGLPVQPDSVRIIQDISRLSVVDAWGKIKIPGGTFDVLRKKRTEISISKFEIKLPIIGWFDVGAISGQNTEPDTSVTYEFLGEGYKSPILTANTTLVGDSIISITYLGGNLVGIFDPIKIAGIKTFPNPANSYLLVDLNSLPIDSEKIILINSIGQTIRTEQITNGGLWHMDTAQIDAGIYQMLILDKNGNAIGRNSIVIQHP